MGNVGDHGQVQVPEGYIFTGPQGTRTVLEAMHNPTSGSEAGLLAPTSSDWFVVFTFDPIGYVRDNEKDDLDPDKILSSLRKGNERANEARRKRGWDEIEILGWETAPHYDESSHNLEWAIRGQVRGDPIVNYNTRLLGRHGVMEATLLVAPQDMVATLPTFLSLLEGYSFTPGKGYSEYREGDKVAKYGLTALVAGGATAVAIKTGLFAKLIKVVFKFGLVAVAVIGGILRALFGRRRTSSP